MRRRRSGTGSWRRRLGLAALALFVAVDMILVVLAFRHVQPVEADSPVASGGLPKPSETGDPSASPDRRPSPRSSASTTAGPFTGTVLLALSPDGTLLRGRSGDCADGTAPSLVASTDSGTTFSEWSPAPDLAELSRLTVDDSGTVQAVGLDTDCEPAVATAASAAAAEGADGSADVAWVGADPDARWYLRPDAGATLHAPGGDVDTPCVPAGLSSTGSIRVLCDGGALIGTSDAGESWAALGRLDGAVAAAYDGPAAAVALAPGEACPVAAFTTADGGSDWTERACLDGADGLDDTDLGGALAVTVRGDLAYAQVGEVLHRSEDGGATWTTTG